jgi:la-related protein 1
MYARFPNGGPGQHMPPPLQASNIYDYVTPVPSMNTAPFNPYIDHSSVLAMVKMQLEYYFSIDNLCKDVFLRKHMDSQGFVFLNFIASFKRIQALTQDFELLYYACLESDIIEQIRGDDGIDRMRRKDGWEKWVLPIEERDESARNAGPSTHWRPPPQYMRPQMIITGNHSMSPLPFSPNGTESSFRAHGNGLPVTSHMNENGNAYHPETPLSAAVPDFAPGLLAVNASNDPLETFTDEEVANLTLVFAPPKAADDSKPKTPYHTSASRTFSNGSIDGRSIAEEMIDDGRQGRALTNGSRAHDG